MVKGIGGIFIYSEHPKQLAEWYKRSLGLTYQYAEENKAYYLTFPYRELETDKERYSIFSILYSGNRPFIADKSFTINLRVENIEDLVAKLESLVVPVNKIETHDEGKFAWINDSEGNYIELWEDVK